MSKILLVVDVQEDFVRGSLPGENALKRIPNMIQRCKNAQKNDEIIIFTQDTHHKDTYMNTQEGKNLPIYHCIKDTIGWNIIEELRPFIDPNYIVEKSTFAPLELIPSIELLLSKGYAEIEIFGICTDICVINTASMLKNHFPETPIYVNASCSAGVTERLHESALCTMKSFHINIID